MNPIVNEDLELIVECSGKEVNSEDFQKLKSVYAKLKHLCELLEAKGFRYDIRQDPRKQAGPGRFLFQEYQWAKVYPSDLYDTTEDKLAYIIGLSDTVHFHMMGIKEYQKQPASLNASKKAWTEVDISNATYEDLVEQFAAFDKKHRPLFIKTAIDLGINELTKNLKEMKQSEIVHLLRYKKQIILQGPPGTGKTRLAKEIASHILGLETPNHQSPKTIDKSQIINNLKAGDVIKTKMGKDLRVIGFEDRVIKVQTDNSQPWTPSYDKVIESYNNRLFDGSGRSGGFVPYEDAIANHLYGKLQKGGSVESTSESIKLLQFHPSYSYEDFVRGIISTPNADGDGIIYKAEDKIFARFAKEALANWVNSRNENNVISQEVWVQEKFEDFIDEISQTLEDKQTIDLTGQVQIVGLDEDAFRYKGKGSWSVKGNRMLFKDIIRAYLDGAVVRQDIRHNKSLSGLANWHATYYIRVLDKFKEFLKNNNATYVERPVENVQPKEFVLIIDEINRANLSSVLGELIYALEYRGENVESMYEVNGSNKLILPPNLYIIGTMNTADRSVGHIDYAIRRRFAFVDVLPQVLDSDFETELFKRVSELFVKDINASELEPSIHLSSEFKPKDVWIGHSYFIRKGDVASSVRLKYEIIPILEEYIKDGVLIESKELRNLINGLENSLIAN